MRKKILPLFLSLFAISTTSQSQSTFFTGGNICSDSEWKLVFQDEFQGDTLDRSKWLNYFPYTANGNDQCEFCRTHGNEGQVYTDTNLEVSNGTLKLIARKQLATWFNATRDYTSALIHSKYEFRFMYGKFEIRCKVPSGKGLNSAYWMFGGNGTEIDDFEISGADPMKHKMGIIKWHETELFARHDYSYRGIDLSQDFHVFSVIWTPFFVTFFLDDNFEFQACRFHTLSGNQVNWCCVSPGIYEDLPAFPSGNNNLVNIIASLGISTGDDAPNANTIFPSQFEIDYIRVYQRDPPSSDNFDCELLLFPNPVSSLLLLRKKSMTHIQIENVMGQTIYSENISLDEARVDVSALNQGIYFVEVETKDGTFANKFIKE